MLTRRSRQAKIEKTLKSLIRDGSFNSAVVASKDGLPVAMVGKTNMAMIAAVAVADHSDFHSSQMVSETLHVCADCCLSSSSCI